MVSDLEIGPGLTLCEAGASSTLSREMRATAAAQRPCDPCTVVIFGAAGDLTKRKLIPALYNLSTHGLLPQQCAVVGVARRPLDDAEFRAQMAAELQRYATSPVSAEVAAAFTARHYFVSGDLADPATYATLAARLEEIRERHQGSGNVLFYMATPPGAFAEIARGLAGAGLDRDPRGGWRRVIVEKPFGHDLDSAVALNQELRRVLDESQIFRIDHYLGKETVQNLLVFRFGNGVFEPIWNRRYIDHVQMTVAEELGVEGRGAFYDEAGVMRDMIQNHMFQLLALVAMEPPISFQGEGVRNEKVKVLEAIRPMQPEQILANTVRGQYGEGTVGGKRVPTYRSEPRVPPQSKTETYAAVKLQVDNWRWAGVPFYLRSGKRLARRATEIVITFRRPPLLLFQRTPVDEIQPNRVVIRIQPDEGISLWVQAKQPGPSISLAPVKLHFGYKDFGAQVETTGYEQLLYDCMFGDPTLFHRADMVEAAWKIATPILDLWASLPARDFPNYPSGSWGPAAADQLIQRDGRAWAQPE
jgi:glucose-6-phosphate 1-dehydrogenase